MSLFDNFVPLDDLIQGAAFYATPKRLSSLVEHACWIVELALVSGGGRWWRGSWSENDVHTNAGSKFSERTLERFAARLANWIIEGELGLGDWSSEGGCEIKLQINPTGSAPVVMVLAELPSAEASMRAITILKEIGLQAQSRQCRINPPVYLATIAADHKPSQPLISKDDKDDNELKKAQEHIKRLEGEVVRAKQVVSENAPPSPSKPVAPKPPRGASKANPTRQKRKIVEAEFESD